MGRLDNPYMMQRWPLKMQENQSLYVSQSWGLNCFEHGKYGRGSMNEEEEEDGREVSEAAWLRGQD